MSHNNDSGTVSTMQAGDVLVTHPTSVREHEISIVPNTPHATVATHAEAIDRGAEEAEALAVDGWVSEDKTHVVRIASHRPEGADRPDQAAAGCVSGDGSRGSSTNPPR